MHRENPCDNRRNIVNKSDVPCPKCGGDLVERRARKSGRPFYGCSRYPDCDFLVNDRPVPGPCPQCGGMMVEKAQNNIRCSSCAWQGEPQESPVQAEKELASVGD